MMTTEKNTTRIDEKQPIKIRRLLQALDKGETPDAKSASDQLMRHFRFNNNIPVVFSDTAKRFTGSELTLELSPSTIKLGLLLLNGKANNAYYTDHFLDSADPRYQVLIKDYDTPRLWQGEHFNLLVLAFGLELAQAVEQAWDNEAKLMYQRGYDRRSFRRPHHAQTTLLQQLNLMNSLLGINTTFALSMVEEIGEGFAVNYYSDSPKCWAAAIDSGNEAVYKLCCDILQGKAEVGDVSEQVIKALLLCNQPKAWEQVGNLLLSAQRQEGLRQVIVECLDETSVGAFQYMLNLINEHQLMRFSAVVRSLDVWAGFAWEAEKQSTVKRFFALAEQFVSHPEQLKSAIKDKDNANVYMALWGQGVHDVDKCYPYLKQLFEKGTLEKKLLVLYFVRETGIIEWCDEFAQLALAENHEQMGYWVVALLNTFIRHHENVSIAAPTLFDDLNSLYQRLLASGKQSVSFSGKVFAWTHFSYTPADVMEIMIDMTSIDNTVQLNALLQNFEQLALVNRQALAEKILPHYSPWGWDREQKPEKPTPLQRDFALRVLSDRSDEIFLRASKALEQADITSEELTTFEALLTRKAANLRKSVLKLIQQQPVEDIFESAERLLGSKNIEQRLAGLDLLDFLHSKAALPQHIAQHVNQQLSLYAKRPKIGKREQILLDKLLDTSHEEYSTDNGFGLFDPHVKTPVESIEKPVTGEFIDRHENGKFAHGLSMPPSKIKAELQKLHDLFIAHKDHEYEVECWDGSRETILLGNEFCEIKDNHNDAQLSPQQQFENYPLHDVWAAWYQQSGLTSFDLFWLHFTDNPNSIHCMVDIDEDDGISDAERLNKAFHKTARKLDKLFNGIAYDNPDKNEYAYRNPLDTILENLHALYPYEAQEDYLIGAAQYLVSQIDDEDAKKTAKRFTWCGELATVLNLPAFEKVLHTLFPLKASQRGVDKVTMLWHIDHCTHSLVSALDMPNTYRQTYISPVPLTLQAYQLKLCNKDELFARLCQPDALQLFTESSTGTDCPKSKIIAEFPFVTDMVEAVITRILDIELQRGDSNTPVSHLVNNIEAIYGVEYLIKILNGLNKTTLHRGYIYHYDDVEYSKKEIFCTLLKRCQPHVKDTQATFNQAIKAATFSDQRLIEVALYAQQWLPFIQNYLGWQDLDAAVWWLHAHTNEYHDAQSETEIARFSAVNINDFNDGAVDYEWFQSLYQSLGKDRWKMVYDAAKYISEGTGHSRAKLYADVMTGHIKIREVSKRIKDKRNQDYVRVYGLIPLSKKIPEKDLLNRYTTLLNFKKESKQFGSQRQSSEALAVRIAMENLARTAGYPDPIRLTWAMETETANTLLSQAKPLIFDEVTIELRIDNVGKSAIHVQRGGKPLKSIPAKLNKEKSVVALKAIHKQFKDQFTRSRKSLEDAMVRGDDFTLAEIQSLMSHPVIAPMLSNLLLCCENEPDKPNKQVKQIKPLGFYCLDDANAVPMLKHADGSCSPLAVSAEQSLRIAHCSDVYHLDGTGETWIAYQRYCFDNQLVQPFKQIFRELYLPTADELQEKTISRRYAGHQVQPKQSVALLKSRQWTVDYEEGLQKVFHKQGVIAKIYAMADWFSPADVESPTLETIEFIARKSYKSVAFVDIEPILFSEVMRDIDLIVSVAHVGGIDPEASHSTVEMRTAIIRETLRLFKLDNVELKGHHAHINGQRGQYSVHLGSGVTHLVPGKALSILPVHSQHRGRLFLPFIDEDPKSAEILSKILLLAKDKDIKDPTILRQL